MRGYNRVRPYEGLYNFLILQAKRRKKLMALSYEEFREFIADGTGQCHYCGKSVKWAIYNAKKYGTNYNLDQKNNNAGYVKDNLVVCCGRCNSAKSDIFTYEQFLKIAEVIRAFD